MLGSRVICKDTSTSCVEQSFSLNKNGTVSPTGAPQTILGLRNDQLVLLSKEENIDLLIFSEIKSPLIESERVFQMGDLKDGIYQSSLMTDSGNQTLRVEKGKVISVVLDEHNYLHKVNQPFQVFNAYSCCFEAKNIDSREQRVILNADGTISSERDPDQVVGHDQNLYVCRVPKSSKNKIVFEGLKNVVKKPHLYRSKFRRYESSIVSPFLPIVIESMEEFDNLKYKVLDTLYSRD